MKTRIKDNHVPWSYSTRMSIHNSELALFQENVLGVWVEVAAGLCKLYEGRSPQTTLTT
jgi:hypothetical protein